MTCGATMRSKDTPNHLHTCGTEHESWEHICSDSACRRWFYQGEV